MLGLIWQRSLEKVEQNDSEYCLDVVKIQTERQEVVEIHDYPCSESILHIKEINLVFVKSQLL